MTKEFRSCFVLVLGLLLLGAAATASSQEPVTIFDAVLGDTGESSPEISTRDLRRILMENSAVVFDARTFQEFAVSHIPGAINVSAKPGVSRSLYVSDVTEVGRRLNGNRTATIVLYCNGPYCGKVKRLATALQTAGYRNVRRYQLGMPVWRALGGVTEVEREGLKYVVSTDRTAVLIDVREPDAYREATFPMLATYRGAVCSKARTWVKSGERRTTGGCRWRTTIPGFSWSDAAGPTLDTSRRR